MMNENLQPRKRKNITLMFTELENTHLTKDVGMIPYIFHKYLNHNSTIACYDNGTYPYLNNEVKGLKLSFIAKSEDSQNDGIKYLMDNSSQIDILYLIGLYDKTINWINVYKEINPLGKVYLKLDANIWWMNRLEISDETIDILKKCHIISVESRKLHDYLNRKWPLRIEYIPNGYYDFFSNRRTNYKEKENIILTVGRIGTYQKANEILLNAFKLASPLISDWKLKLIGAVEADFKLYIDEFLLENPSLKDKIILTGQINDKLLLEKEYRKAKVFSLTSRNEGFPLVFTEAAANGCFIVSSDLDPAYDITDNERYGMIFPVDDIEALSKALIKICNDDSRLQRVCDDIQDYTLDNFEWIRICKKLDLLFNLS